MSRAGRLKSATTCFRAGSYLPAAGPMPVTAVRSQISKANHHDHRKTYVSAPRGVRGFVSHSTGYRTAGNRKSHQ
jgi:hypothetical protein